MQHDSPPPPKDKQYFLTPSMLPKENDSVVIQSRIAEVKSLQQKSSSLQNTKRTRNILGYPMIKKSKTFDLNS